MAKDRGSPKQRNLRKKAEDFGKHQAPPEKSAKARRIKEADPLRLFDELEVHRIELEMQNEELRQTQVALQASATRYEELFDFAPLGYAVLGADGTIREINHVGARYFGRDRSRLIGVRFRLFVAAQHLSAFNAMVEKARETETKQSADLKLRVHQGRPGLFFASAIVLSGPEGTILIGFEDMRERDAREEKLRQTEVALREASRRKDEFLAALAHELRNPLGPIRTSLFLLSRIQPVDERAARALGIVDRQVTHLSRLINDLLDVARIASGKIQLQRSRLDLVELVRATVEDHRTNFDTARICVETRFQEKAIWMVADADRLILAVSNVLGNAGKFTSAGGSVVVSLHRAGAEVVLRVRDTGVGLTAETLAHAFEPFAQGPQMIERAQGGLGLGLATVKGLVELHGGRVTLSSDGPGRGAEVTIHLPIEVGTPEESRATNVEPAQHRAQRVLLIEDNRDAATSLADVLGSHGHVVCVAFDGPTGVELARRFHPNVVVADIGLPGMSGYAIAQSLRSDDSFADTQLIALTGYGRPEDLQRGTAAGFNHYLTKPANMDELERLISELPRLPR